MHPGRRYRIHLWDGHKSVRAEKSAGIYARPRRGSRHAWHMPGHTYTELKRYADAAYQQEGAARVDHAYMVRDHVMPFEIHNYAHNNQWLCTSLSHIGRGASHRGGAKPGGAATRPGQERPQRWRVAPNAAGGPGGLKSGPLRMWDELIAATTSGVSTGPIFRSRRAESVYLGLAHAARNDPQMLAAQVEGIAKAERSGAKSALAELEGWQFLARGDVGPGL